MRTIKAFVFTLDAIFALIVATAASSILLYLHFSAPVGLQVPPSQAQSLMQNLLNTQLGQVSLGSIFPAPYSTPYTSTSSGTKVATFYGNSYLFLPVLTSYAPKNFSINFWINPVNNSGGSNSVILYGGPSNTLQLAYTSGGLISMRVNRSNGFDHYLLSGNSNTVLAPNKWSQITYVAACDGNLINNDTLYINGIAVSVVSTSYTICPNTGPYLFFGSSFNYPSNSVIYPMNFTGKMTNIQVYNANLSASQVRQLYQEGIGGIPLSSSAMPFLAGWWPLNGDAYDASNKGNTGTLGNIGFTNADYLPFPNVNVPFNSSLLQTLAELYTNKQSAFADMIVSSTEGSNRVAIMVNNNFAPSLNNALLNGQNSMIYAPVGTWLGQATNFSAAAWLYSPSGGGLAFGISCSPFSNSCQNIPIISMNSSAHILGYVSTYYMNYSGSFNTWYFVTVTYNRITHGEILYVNGKRITNVTATYTPTGSFYYLTTYLPTSTHGIPKFFNGNLGNMQIYNSTLTALQVAQLYQSGMEGIPLNVPTLKGWWQLGGDVNDYSQYHNSGQSYNVIYTQSNYAPQSLSSSYVVGKSSIPLVVNQNGVITMQNVGVLVWR